MKDRRRTVIMKLRSSYDFYLIFATTVVLFAIALISIYAMFYFKFARIHELAPALKLVYMNRMNQIVAPFIICLILLLGICIPKRLLPTDRLHFLTAILLAGVIVTTLFAGIKAGLFFMLAAALFLQIIVFLMSLTGGRRLHFHRKGYWVRLGSSLIHLGLILFILDLFFYRHKTMHLYLFWITTGASVLGMLFCFYAESFVSLVTGKRSAADESVP